MAGYCLRNTPIRSYISKNQIDIALKLEMFEQAHVRRGSAAKCVDCKNRVQSVAMVLFVFTENMHRIVIVW